ncbi:hypothetical protein PGB90_008067 [Kerria lacca]
MDTDVNSSFSEEDLALTVKILAQDPEIFSIIGDDSVILNQIREQSGASISISEGSIPDRIITITGTLEELYDACKLIIQRFEICFNEDIGDNMNESESLIVKLIVPASQCGPLIGKGGSKIKEIRDSTGAAMQVAADMLPNSTERIVNISGSVEAILDCIYEISLILLSTPQKFHVVSYCPNCDLLEGPIIFSEGKIYTLQGSSAIPVADLEFLYKNDLMKQFFGINTITDFSVLSKIIKLPTINKNFKEKRHGFIVQELHVPEDAVSGMFGKHGIKVSEIRQITGAMILLSNNDDGSSSDGRDKVITIKGTHESVALAKYLINANIELQKMNPENQSNSEQSENMDSDSATASLTNSLTKPGAMSILSSLVGFQNISEFLNSF